MMRFEPDEREAQVVQSKRPPEEEYDFPLDQRYRIAEGLQFELDDLEPTE